jgi:hypothetical protein
MGRAIGVGRIRRNNAENRLRESESIPRNVKKEMGLRSPVDDWKTLSEENEERTSEEREIKESGTERDNVGCEGNDSDAENQRLFCREMMDVPHVKAAKYDPTVAPPIKKYARVSHKWM